MNFAPALAPTPRIKRSKLHLPVEVAAETFRCTPYRCVLTRQKCAERYDSANQKGSTRPGAAAMRAKVIFGSSCTGCTVGEAHRHGQVPEDAPAIARPTVPSGHSAPSQLQAVGDAPSFQVNVARNAAVASEARQAKFPRKKDTRTAEDWRKYRPIKPCRLCGKPKQTIRPGVQTCDDCRASVDQRRKQYYRQQYEKKRANKVPVPCPCGAPKVPGPGQHLCADCRVRNAERRSKGLPAVRGAEGAAA